MYDINPIYFSVPVLLLKQPQTLVFWCCGYRARLGCCRTEHQAFLKAGRPLLCMFWVCRRVQESFHDSLCRTFSRWVPQWDSHVCLFYDVIVFAFVFLNCEHAEHFLAFSSAKGIAWIISSMLVQGGFQRFRSSLSKLGKIPTDVMPS